MNKQMTTQQAGQQPGQQAGQALAPQRLGQIHGIPAILPERGKIKIGRKGQEITSRSGSRFQPPQKLDYFIVTTPERGQDGNFIRDEAIHRQIGNAPKEIPVRLLYDDVDLNVQSRYASFDGRRMWCSGNGETALRTSKDGSARESVSCPCHLANPDYTGDKKCKINARLQVLIDNTASVGGVWTFRTTSFNTLSGLLASLNFIKSITNGVLANIPLALRVSPKNATAPDGKQQTIYVVSLEFKGTIEELTDRSYRIALARTQAGVRIEQIEATARHLLALPPPEEAPFDGETAEDVVEEYYHEEASRGAEDAAAPPTRADIASQQTGTDACPFALIDCEGNEIEFDSFENYARHFCKLMNDRTKQADAAGLAGLWESNAGLLDRLETDHAPGVAKLREFHTRRAAQLKAGQETPAMQEQPQPEPAEPGQPADQPVPQADSAAAAEPSAEPSADAKAEPKPWIFHPVHQPRSQPMALDMQQFQTAMGRALREIGYAPSKAQQIWWANREGLERLLETDAEEFALMVSASLRAAGWPDDIEQAATHISQPADA